MFDGRVPVHGCDHQPAGALIRLNGPAHPSPHGSIGLFHDFAAKKTQRVNWLLDQVDRFWPDWLLVLWAQFAIALGAIILLLALVRAVRHYGLDRPMRDSDTGPIFTPAQSLTWFLQFGGGGALFFALGILVYVWKAG